MPLAAHLVTPERARALYLLTLADRDLDPPVRSRLDDLYELLQGVLARPELAGREARNVLERARAEAQRLAPNASARERLDVAPRAWLLAHPPAELARQAALADPPLRTGRYRVAVGNDRIDVVTADRRGVLAAVANLLSAAELTIERASTATWPDGAVVMSFEVDGEPPPADALAERLSRATFVWGTHPVEGVQLAFDDHASPWHTIVDVRAPDRPGLLAAIAAAFAGAGLSIHALEAGTVDGEARDRFEVTDRHGAKLHESDRAAVEANLLAGSRSNGSSRGPRAGRKGGRWRTRKPAIDTKHSAHSLETADS
jgi:[protein-PII] uridylyltransferase